MKRRNRQQRHLEFLRKRELRLEVERRASIRASGVIGEVNGDGFVALPTGELVAAADFIQSVRTYARRTGTVRRDGNLVFLEFGPQAEVPPGEPRAFEGHPYFSERVEIAGRPAFHTRGPATPLPTLTLVPLVERVGSLFVLLSDQPKHRRWRTQNYQITHAAEASQTLVDRLWSAREAEAREKAAAAIEALYRTVEVEVAEATKEVEA